MTRGDEITLAECG